MRVENSQQNINFCRLRNLQNFYLESLCLFLNSKETVYTIFNRCYKSKIKKRITTRTIYYESIK